MLNFYSLLRPLLFALAAEKAHSMTLETLNLLYRLKLLFYPTVNNPTEIMGLNFSNPVGLAAGLDKNGDYIDALGALGFGFIEVGTITPLPQAGKPQPRLFRLPQDKALINRMGFNNKGVDHLVKRLKTRRYPGIVGVNIGKNEQTPLAEASRDYLTVLTKVYPYSDYCVINISSPNTTQLRELQTKEYLSNLLNELKKHQLRLSEQYHCYRPLVVKLAPDLTEEALTWIAKCLLNEGIDGVIMSNTTLDRPKLVNKVLAQEVGGLSGLPLQEKADNRLAILADCLQNRLPIIGVGGILHQQDAQRKITQGASLVQLYTGLIYQGPGLISACANIQLPLSRTDGN